MNTYYAFGENLDELMLLGSFEGYTWAFEAAEELDKPDLWVLSESDARVLLKAMLDKLEPKLVSTFKDMVQGLYVEHAESCIHDEDACPYLRTYLEASRIADNF